jgi:hypothetical protein
VQFACFDGVRNTEAWNTTPWFPVYYIFPHIGNNLPHDGRCSSGREIASSNVEGVFLADGTAKALR